MFFGLDLNQEEEALTILRSVGLGGMVGAFSQNNVTLTGLPMILPSESDLTY